VFDIVFVIILIPVFDRIIYPRLARAGRPMGFVLRVSMGMVIAAIAVCVAGVVEHYRLKSLYQNDSSPCNNISVILWWLVLLVEETGVHEEDDRPVASH
jgi:dipeptide/tripeptide permease